MGCSCEHLSFPRLACHLCQWLALLPCRHVSNRVVRITASQCDFRFDVFFSFSFSFLVTFLVFYFFVLVFVNENHTAASYVHFMNQWVDVKGTAVTFSARNSGILDIFCILFCADLIDLQQSKFQNCCPGWFLYCFGFLNAVGYDATNSR